MGFHYNLLSGLFASLAGLFTKYGFNFDPDGPLPTLLKTYIPSNDSPPHLLYLLHALAIALMLLSNALMLKFYVKSMHSNGAAKATVYNFAVNYLGSMVLGAIVFGEKIGTRGVLGVAMIVAGTAIIS